MLTLTRLFIHPVKSMRGIQQSHALATESGFACDRIFMVTETDGTFITARQHPEMVLFTPAPLHDGLHISAADGSSAVVRFADFNPQPAPTEVWGNRFNALIAPDDINRWLSGFFARDVQLRWVGHQPARRVKRFETVPLSFADGFPYLLTSEASLRDLQRRCPAGVSMDQFRPNLVVSGAEAWDEDSWETISIGNVMFAVVEPCSRCVLTSVSPARGQRHPDGEPLATLQRFRSDAVSGEVDFGQNLIARGSGVLRIGDRVEVLTRKAPKQYVAAPEPEAAPPIAAQTTTVEIDWQGETFSGNNQQVLLEQLEQQGIRVPYSCRAGLCGKCRVRLLEGDVTPLKQSALVGDGTVLSCSCVPASAIRLAMKEWAIPLRRTSALGKQAAGAGDRS